MSIVLHAAQLQGLHLRNRFVRSATWEGMADSAGMATPGLIALMASLAKGGVGLIITGHTYVSPEGKASPGKLGATTDAHIAGLAAMARAVHDAGGCIALQLAHAGGEAMKELTGHTPIAPSAMANQKGETARAMTAPDIETVVAAFAAAAVRAQRAGFDAVQIHAAHGYLLSQFLSPFFNKRTDEYGGDIQGRARLLREAVAAVRAAVGSAFPVMVKINTQDFTEPGITVDDLCALAAMLEAAGVAAIELSGGTRYSGNNVPVRRGRNQGVYYRDAAACCKRVVRTPVMLVGGIRDLATAEALVDDGCADFISMSRPFIREPELVAQWQRGGTMAAACISCNLCFRSAQQGTGLVCGAAARSAKGEGRSD